MQDRYAGDVGDYVKLALLRHLSGAGRRLGIAWYLHPDTTDGGHIRYLSDPARWRHLDYKLFDALAGIAGGQRSTAALEAASVPDAIYTAERLDCTAVTYIDRDRWRHDWFKRVLRNSPSAISFSPILTTGLLTTDPSVVDAPSFASRFL